MRRFTIIAVAVLLVATGGPAPCPCHLTALLRPADGKNPQTPAPKRPACKCCSCRGAVVESEADARPRCLQTRTQEPAKLPCEHGPKVDLGSAGTSAEWSVDAGTDPIGLAGTVLVAGSHDAPGGSIVFIPPPGRSPPHLSALRFVHAFRS